MPGASVLEQLISELESVKKVGFRHTTPSGTPSTPYMHGPGGIFSQSGISRDLFSTHVRPTGLISALPARGTIDTNPLFGYITGFQDVSGSVAAGVCDDPETAGAIKGCLQTAQFGRYSYMTRESEINALGRRTNRGEFMDLRVVNNPLMETLGIGNPNVPGNPDLARDVLERMLEVGIAFQRKLLRQVYTGNPANNNVGGGYREFPGLDILIGTDKVDAITGANCPSLDSDIKNFSYGLVDAAGGNTIVNVLTYLMRMLESRSETMGFDPTEWIIAMRQSLFWELTAVWPCSYLTYRCSFNAIDGSKVVNVDAGDHIAMRDAMRAGHYLLIDGKQYPVAIDGGIVEETNTDTASVTSGCFASDIYVIPVSVRGGLGVTFFEYLDYMKGAMIGAADGNYANDDFWTDGGRYLWHKKPPTNWCIQHLAKIEPRLVLLTPHLAGRLQNVQYCPLQHERDALPDDPYFVDGGVTSRAAPSFYSDWNLPA